MALCARESRGVLITAVVGILALALAGATRGQGQPAEPPKALAVRDDLPPDRAIVLDLRRAWVVREDDRAPLKRGERFGYEALLDAVRFTMEDPGLENQWMLFFDAPVDVVAYPICVATYRAREVAAAPGAGTYLCLTGAGQTRYVHVLGAGTLVADGQVHENRVDLRGRMKQVHYLELSLRCGTKVPAVLDVLQLRFEAALPAEAANLSNRKPIEVAVTDGQGVALQGAIVIVDPQWPNAARKALTDADGIARVTPAASAPVHVFRAEMADMAPREVAPTGALGGHVNPFGPPAPPVPAAEVSTVRISLERGVSYGATIRDEEGNPVPGVTVYLNTAMKGLNTHVPEPLIVYPSFPSFMNWHSRDTLVLRTDEQGRWRSPPLPANLAQLQLMLLRPEYVNCHAFNMWNRTPPIEDLRAGNAVITLRRGVTLEGRVLNANGAPFENVTAAMEEGQWGYDSRGMLTVAGGRFRFEGVAPGYCALFFKKDGFAPQMMVARAKEGMKPIEVCMHPAAKVRGRVLGPDGMPVSGARIVVYTWHGYHNPLNWHGFNMPLNKGVRTRADGRFTWEDAPDDEARFTVIAPGFLETRDFPMAASEREYVISLRKAPMFSGQVLDAETKAPVHAVVTLLDQEQPEDSSLRRDHSALAVVSWGIPQGPALNQQGIALGTAFQLAAAQPACARRLWVTAPGYESLLTEAFKDEDGSRTVNLKLKKRMGATVTVIGPDGAPAANAEVAIGEPGIELLMRNARAKPASADRDVHIEDYCAAEMYPVEAYLRPFIPPRESSHGVRDEPWSPESLVWQDLLRHCDAEGRFMLPADPQLTPAVMTHPGGYAVATVGDCTGSAALRLQPWGRLEGTLLVGGKPAPGQAVALDCAPQVPAASPAPPAVCWNFRAVTNAQGRFVFERVPAGMAFLRQVLGEGWFTSYGHKTVVEVKGGAVCQATLGGTERRIVGKLEVLLPDGSEPDWSLARVTLAPRGFAPAAMPAAWRRVEAAVQPDGAFRIEDVEPGEYDLTAVLYQSGGYRWPLTGAVQAGAGRALAVPETAAMLDLGGIPLRAAGKLEPGLPAPEWQAETTLGKRLSSASFRGKFLLLVFWVPGTLGMERDAEMLKAIHAKYKGDPRLVMLSITPADSAVVKDYAERKALNWEHCTPIGASRPGLLFAYGVAQPLDVPCCFLIGPDGKVAAINMQSDDVPKALEWKLQTPKDSAR